MALFEHETVIFGRLLRRLFNERSIGIPKHHEQIIGNVGCHVYISKLELRLGYARHGNVCNSVLSRTNGEPGDSICEHDRRCPEKRSF